MKVGLVGFGWLGKVFYESCATQAIDCIAFVRSAEKCSELAKLGISSSQLITKDFPEIDLKVGQTLSHLLICIPPSKNDNVLQYSKQVLALITNVSAECKVLFTSSTSVYPNVAQEMREDFKFETDWVSQNAILLAEKSLGSILNERLTIFRLGGLVGKDRQLAKYVSGKVLTNPNASVNLVEQKDVISALDFWLKYELNSNIYNLVCPTIVNRKKYYLFACDKLKLPLPIIDDFDYSSTKTIIGTKITLENDFHYFYDNVLQFFDE